MSMLDRIVGAKKLEANGHLPADADLITDSAQLAARATPWEAVQAARNIKRPHTLDVVARVFDHFQELHGDRGFRDDPAIVGVILGEGGSGGALAPAIGDVVLAMQNAIYSVISPEGSAAILWRSPAEAERAAKAMRLAGPDLLDLGVVDALIPEPSGGAHTDHEATAKAVKTALVAQLAKLERVAIPDLLSSRYERFRAFGAFAEPGTAVAPPPAAPWWRKLPKMLGRDRT